MRIWITAFADMGADRGSSRHLQELTRGLGSRGHEVVLFASKQSGAKVPEGVVLVPMPQIPLPGLRYFSGVVFFQIFLIWHMIRNFSVQRPDILYARHDAFLFAPALFARWKKIPLVSEINGVLSFELHLRGHGPLGIGVSDWIERWVYRTSVYVVVVAEQMARHVKEHCNVPAGKVLVSHNGADLARFAPGENLEVRKRIDAQEQDVVLGYVGGLQPYQGVSLFVEAASVLAGEGLPVKVLVVGGGAEEKRLREMAGSDPLQGRMTVLGEIAYEEVPEYLRAMDVCALPKLGKVKGSPYAYSASPLKAFEYMACAKPIVANDLPDFRFLHEADAALLADVENVTAFADALRCLVTDEMRRRRLGQAGLCYAKEKGSWDASIGRVGDLLERVRKE